LTKYIQLPLLKKNGNNTCKYDSSFFQTDEKKV
jgi:hypothetical protein